MRPSPRHRLFASRRPPAIRRFVVAIVVDSVKCQAFRRFAHICKELCKGASPTCAYSDAAAAVVPPADVLRVGAALDHVLPDAVCPRARHVVGAPEPRSVSPFSLFPGDFPQEASARARVACLDGVSAHHHVSTTVTATKNQPVKTVGARFLNHEKPAKASTSEVNLGGHRVTSGVMRPAATTVRPLFCEVILP